MREEVYNILRESGPIDISGTYTYVTVKGTEKEPKPLKVLKVRPNAEHEHLEFVAEGIDFWLTEDACIMNTAPKLYEAVLSRTTNPNVLD